MIRDTSKSDRTISVQPSWYQGKPATIAIAVGSLLGLFLLAYAFWPSGNFSINAERLRFADVTRGTLIRDTNVNGRVVAAQSATLYSSANGTIALKHRAGDRVEKDAVIASIDSPDLSNELLREKSTLQRLVSELSRQRILTKRQQLSARKAADEAALALTSANRDAQRYVEACKSGVLSKVDCLRTQDAVKSAEIRLQHADAEAALEEQMVEFDLSTRVQDHQRQKLVVENLERRVDELNLRSPVAGVIGSVMVADRAVLPVNAPVMTIVDLTRLDIELAVPESYADDLGLEMSVEVQIGTSKAGGTIAAISPEVTNNQVLARVRLDEQVQSGLRQNQRVSARILFEEKADVLMLQRGPFVESGGGRFVYVMEDGMAVRRSITLGASSVSAVEIIDGLNLNERVIISGSENFRDAEIVQIN